MITTQPVPTVVTALALSALACGEPALGAAASEHAINGGLETNQWTEVMNVPSCSGTLIAPDWVLTAAHCIAYTDRRYATWPAAEREIIFTTTEGFVRPRAVVASWALGVEPGPYDLALYRLAAPVEEELDRPRWISETPPIQGEWATFVGYGRDCTVPTAPFTKRFTMSRWNTSADLCSGDSGGPAFRGRFWESGDIIGVHSAGDATTINVEALPGQVRHIIEALKRSVEGRLAAGWDRPGFTYSSFPLPDTVAGHNRCADECNEDHRCRAFAYSSASGVCELKDAVPDVVPESRSISGVRDTSVSFDRAGSDYRWLPAANHEVCESECAAEAQCAAFTFYNGGCWLKHSVPGISHCPACQSGDRRGIEDDTDRPGGDFWSEFIGANVPATCAVLCARDEDCLAFSYSSATGVCSLKNQVSDPVRAVGVYSGRRGGLEYGVDRPGMDIEDFELAEPRPDHCAANCERNPQCRSWTYVPPVPDVRDLNGDGEPDLNTTFPPLEPAHCWLKSGVPGAVARPGLVSGRRGMEFF